MSYWCCCCVGAGGGGGRRRDRVAEHFIGCLGHSRRHRGAYLDGVDVGRGGGIRGKHVARGSPEVVARVEGYRVGYVEDDAWRAGVRRRPLQQVGLLRALLGREPQLLGLIELADPRLVLRYGVVLRLYILEEHLGGLGVGRLCRVDTLGCEERVGLAELVAEELADSACRLSLVAAGHP